MASDPQTATRTAFQEWLEKGNDLAWAGEWQQAALAYRRAIELNDREPEIFANLGLALFEAGELRRALDAYEQLLQRLPRDETALRLPALRKIAEIHAALDEKLQAASAYLLLADSYMKARQPAEAVRAWQQVVRYDPMNHTAYRRLAEAYRRGRRNDLAAQALLALARIQADAGETDGAIALSRQAIELQPDWPPAHQLLALLQAPPVSATTAPGTGILGTGPLRRGTNPLRSGTGSLRSPGTGPLDFDVLQGEAREEAAPRDGGPSPTELAQRRALARLAEAFFTEDSADLRVESLKAKAIDLQTRGLVEEAARTFEEIVRAGGGSDEVHYTLGTLYQTMLRFDDAIAQFRRVARTRDYATAAHFAIGQCYQHQGRADEALAHFLEALKIIDMQAVGLDQADEIIRLYEGLADSYEAKGDRTQAEHFTNLLVEFLASRGWDDKLRELRARLGASPESLNLVELLDIPDSDAVLMAMEAATQYQTQGRIRAAIDELYWVLPTAPYYLPLHLLLAELFLADGRLEDAVAKLTMVADVYITRGNPKQAILALQRALECAPADQAVRSRLIDLLMLHGEIDEAIDQYLQLAEGFYQLLQVERAVEMLNEALRLAPRSTRPDEWTLRIQRRLADIHMQRLDWRRAIAAYEGIYAQRPLDGEVAQRLADLYFKLGAEERALAVISNTADRLMEDEGSFASLRFMEQQVEQRPNDVNLLRMLGELQAAVGNTEGAAQSWERAVELLVRRGERSQGAALLRRLVALHSANEARYRAMLQYLQRV